MFRERIYCILAKNEGTSGVDATPDPATNAVRTVGVPVLKGNYLESGDRSDAQNGTMITPDKAAAAGRYATIDVTLEVKGSGAAGTAPEADAFLRACGFSKTVSAGVSVLYTTLDDGMETMTLYCYSANKLFILVGCVATMRLSAEAAKKGQMVFSVTGKMASDPSEASLPGTLALPAVIPPLFHSAAASIGAWTSGAADPLVLKSASVDLKNAVAARPSAGATDGLIGYLVTGRNAEQTMKVEVPQLTTFDAFALSKAVGSAMPVSAWQIGTAAGNRVKIATGRWSVKWPDLGATDGISTMDLGGTLGPGANGAATRELALLFD